MDKLKEFYNDQAMMEAVAEHFVDEFNKEAISRAYNGKDNVGMKDAYNLIEKGFKVIRERYSPKEEKRVAKTRV